MQLTLKRLFLVNLLTCVTMVADGQGLSGSRTKSSRFVYTANTRIASSIMRSLPVPTSTLCAAECLADRYCVGYNVISVISQPDSSTLLQCDIANEVGQTVTDSSSLAATVEIISQESDADYGTVNPVVAFSVNITAYHPAAGVVQFPNISLNAGNGYDTFTNTFVVPQYGLYWFHLHTWTDSLTQGEYYMTATRWYGSVGLLRKDQLFFGHDAMSRDDLRWLPSRTLVYVTSLFNSSHDSSAITLWFGVKLSDFMSPLVAFNVHLPSSMSMPFTLGSAVQFSQIVVNVGGGWNPTTYEFVAPVTGIYVFSVTVAAPTMSGTFFTLMISGLGSVFSVDLQDTLQNGADMATRTFPVALNKSQSVWIEGSGSQYLSYEYELYSFKGFLYSPVSGVQVIWAVLTNITSSADQNNNIAFPTVMINVGDAWQASAKQAIIPTTGIYYVITTANQQSTSSGVAIGLYVNGVRVSYVMKASGSGNGTVTREAAYLLSLNATDTVSVRDISGGHQAITSFAGFLLYPQGFQGQGQGPLYSNYPGDNLDGGSSLTISNSYK